MTRARLLQFCDAQCLKNFSNATSCASDRLISPGDFVGGITDETDGGFPPGCGCNQSSFKMGNAVHDRIISQRENDTCFLSSFLRLAERIEGLIPWHSAVRLTEIATHHTGDPLKRSLNGASARTIIAFEPHETATGYILYRSRKTDRTCQFFPTPISSLLCQSRELWQTHMRAPHLAAYREATDGAVETFTLNEMTKVV